VMVTSVMIDGNGDDDEKYTKVMLMGCCWPW
jgi:hypothetical protein